MKCDRHCQIAVMRKSLKPFTRILHRAWLLCMQKTRRKTCAIVTPKDLEEAKIERKDLRTIACENLKRLLPKIERHGDRGSYIITAGGNYEASLLVLDSIWTGGQMDVKGDIVVAIPTRDLLLVTGSEDREGIAKVKQMVTKTYAEGTYRLTPKLFVFRNGKFNELLSPTR